MEDKVGSLKLLVIIIIIGPSFQQSRSDGQNDSISFPSPSSCYLFYGKHFGDDIQVHNNSIYFLSQDLIKDAFYVIILHI